VLGRGLGRLGLCVKVGVGSKIRFARLADVTSVESGSRGSACVRLNDAECGKWEGREREREGGRWLGGGDFAVQSILWTSSGATHCARDTLAEANFFLIIIVEIYCVITTLDHDSSLEPRWFTTVVDS